MTHRTNKPRRLTLSALALASCLFAMHGGCVVHAQKKSGGKVKPARGQEQQAFAPSGVSAARVASVFTGPARASQQSA